ncbi:MAG: hypothetical protein ABJN96_07760 [Marinomonas sp.]
MSNIFISLTSYGERINTVHHVVSSLKKQSARVDKIILWLDENELKKEEVPDSLSNLEDSVFEVRFCPNYKSYKKLIPTLHAYPEVTVITFDDDIIIPDGVVDCFIDAHLKCPDAIVASRGRLIARNDEKVLESYDQWMLINNPTNVTSEYGILPIGYGGVLYPTGSLNNKVLDSEVFMTLADNADDIWFKCMSLLNHTPTLILPRKVSEKFHVIDRTQDVALYRTVNTEDRNLKCFYAIKNKYKELDVIFEKDSFTQVSIDSQFLHDLLSRPKLFDSKSDAVDFFRSAAIEVEGVNIKLADKLMRIARKYRPNGPLINKKIQVYKEKIAKSKILRD